MKHRELHVVITQTHGHWSASLAHSPELGYGGKTAREAARRLLHDSAIVDLDEGHLIETSAVESDGRLELVVRVGE
ncbi:hypothetical protein ETAA8_39520 [Anatilimnocola aggregata]|uniref:Uncharacterized protein n=1 Tax=Anatilimnocola aggregata TaxID=2528021 RepID=A0A517YF36_9BACT|nr:hypothetical protein [Anatilimnocola aggregata]QDU28847.1 hypothetical protein ETAA8_39520 [Anatilimnocola aggregata]